MSTDETEEILNEVEQEDDAIAAPLTEDEKVIPPFGSVEWSDYLLTLFHESELDNGAPRCDGLRRVCEEVIGPIYETAISHLEPPRTPNGVATVAVGIRVLIENSLHPLFDLKNEIYVEDVADCGTHNTDPKYAAHASATAATKAEARALRKLLRFRGIAADEKSSELTAWELEEPIDDAQLNVLDVLCKRNDINVLDLLSSGKTKYTSVDKVSRSVAATMIQYLSDIQRGTKQKPASVGSYNPNWR